MKSEVGRWLEGAESDLTLAQKGKVSKKVRYNTLCFHSQQAVEKSLKAILIFLDIEYPRTHNISLLLTIIEKGGINVPKIIFPASELTKFTAMRYPDENDEINASEYKNSIAIAKKVFQWAKQIIHKKSDKLL